MIRHSCFLFAACAITACHHKAPVAAQAKAERPLLHISDWAPVPAGTRLLYQFNDERPIVLVTDGHGGPPLLYQGHPLNPDQIKSIMILKKRDARERFGDQTLDAAILIELK